MVPFEIMEKLYGS